jgi:hypothetical protein
MDGGEEWSQRLVGLLVAIGQLCRARSAKDQCYDGCRHEPPACTRWYNQGSPSFCARTKRPRSAGLITIVMVNARWQAIVGSQDVENSGQDVDGGGWRLIQKLIKSVAVAGREEPPAGVSGLVCRGELACPPA